MVDWDNLNTCKCMYICMRCFRILVALSNNKALVWAVARKMLLFYIWEGVQTYLILFLEKVLLWPQYFQYFQLYSITSLLFIETLSLPSCFQIFLLHIYCMWHRDYNLFRELLGSSSTKCSVDTPSLQTSRVKWFRVLLSLRKRTKNM